MSEEATASVQRFLTDAIEAYELVREFGYRKIGKKQFGNEGLQHQILEFIPYAAANQYLFSAEQCGKIVSMAIAGPTNKPSGIHCLHPGGHLLFCFYALIHPQWRFIRRTKLLFRAMFHVMISQFPYCEELCYFRNGAFKDFKISRVSGLLEPKTKPEPEIGALP